MRTLTTSILSMTWALCHGGEGSLQEYTTHSGKAVSVMETHLVGASLSNIRIRSEGFEHEFDETLEDVDPVREVLVADLDGDGFDEIYIITVAAGSGSYGNVIAIVSNRDKSMSMANFPQIEQGSPAFDGYQGHDVFTIENQRLVRSFPLYKETDSNAYPTGGTRKVVYGLKPGEAIWQLVIEAVESID